MSTRNPALLLLRTLGLVLGALLALLCAPASAHLVVADHTDRVPSLDPLMSMRVSVGTLIGDLTGTQGLPVNWCGTETAVNLDDGGAAELSQVKLVYAHPADLPDRFPALADMLQADVALIGRYMAEQSLGAKTVRFDMGTRCGGRYVDVASVTLPRAASYYRDAAGEPVKERVDADLQQALPPAAGPRHYLVYVDGLANGDLPYGIASEPIDDSAGSTNAANSDGLIAEVWGPSSYDGADGSTGYQPALFLHELSHTLGAVQDSAPHATGAGHCNDGEDVMCYADGGPTSLMTLPCRLLAGVIDQTFDCNHDDYFNPVPLPGSYLATHWNVYDSAFLAPCGERGAACAPPLPADPSSSSVDQAIQVTPSTRQTVALKWTAARYRRLRAPGRIRVSVRSRVATVSAGPLRLPAGRWSVRTCLESQSGGLLTRQCARRRVRGGGAAATTRLSLRLGSSVSAVGGYAEIRDSRGRLAASTARSTRRLLSIA